MSDIEHEMLSTSGDITPPSTTASTASRGTSQPSILASALIGISNLQSDQPIFTVKPPDPLHFGKYTISNWTLWKQLVMATLLHRVKLQCSSTSVKKVYVNLNYGDGSPSEIKRKQPN